MKYVLVDNLTGNIIQSARSAMEPDFTQDIYNAALFANKKNAEQALARMYNEDGSLAARAWTLYLGKPRDHKHSITYWTSAELRDECADCIESIGLNSSKEEADGIRSCEIKGFDLEIRGVEFRLV